MEREKIVAGDKLKNAAGEYRIMVIAEGYCMCRRKGCMPFILTRKEVISDKENFK